MILLEYRSRYSINLGKNMQKFQEKKTKQVHWLTQRSYLNTNYTSKAEILLPELYSTKDVACNFHVGDLKGCHRYDMIQGHDIFSELNI